MRGSPRRHFDELSDVMPAKLHMTVPGGFRRREVPAILVLHRGVVEASDRVQFEGYEVTTPRRTLLDLLRRPIISHEQIAIAIGQAYNRGMINRPDIANWRRDAAIKQDPLETLIKEAGIE